jgi:hypothetical protein
MLCRLQGLPLSLNGVKRIMTSMDWGDAEDFVSIGAVGAEEVSASVQGCRVPQTDRCRLIASGHSSNLSLWPCIAIHSYLADQVLKAHDWF